MLTEFLRNLKSRNNKIISGPHLSLSRLIKEKLKYLVGDFKVVKIVGEGRNSDVLGGDAVVAGRIRFRRRFGAFGAQKS